MLDVGAGSGILAVAAAHLGAAEVVAIEGDPLACEALEENLVRNGVSRRVRMAQGWADEASLREYHPVSGVVANLEAGILTPLFPGLTGAIEAGGWLIVSGVIEDEWPNVERALVGAGSSASTPMVSGARGSSGGSPDHGLSGRPLGQHDRVPAADLERGAGIDAPAEPANTLPKLERRPRCVGRVARIGDDDHPRLARWPRSAVGSTGAPGAAPWLENPESVGVLLEHGPKAGGVEASIDTFGHQVDELEESESRMRVRAQLVFCTDGDRVHLSLPWFDAGVCEGPKALVCDGAPPCQEGTARFRDRLGRLAHRGADRVLSARHIWFRR